MFQTLLVWRVVRRVRSLRHGLQGLGHVSNLVGVESGSEARVLKETKSL